MIALLLLACNGGGLFDKDDLDSDTPSETCVEDELVFRDNVWTPVLGTQCALCHVEGAVGGDTRLVLDPNDLRTSQRVAASLGEDLLLKPTGQHPDGHGGGQVISPNSDEARIIEAFVSWGFGDCEALDVDLEVCEDVAGPRLLRRLTHAEYDRTVEALLGLPSSWGAGFAADEAVEGFDNDAEALVVSSLLADQYRQAAEALAWEADVEALLPCDPYAIGRANCAQAFIEDFGLRAFRRPLNETDLERYQALWTAVALDDGINEGLRWVIAAMLQSPSFLYRSELGVQGQAGQFELSDWELASALSYTLWGAPPDSALLALAEAGELHTRDQLLAEAERMLEDPQALDTAADLVDVWLQLDRLQTVSREGLSDEVRADMAAETRALVRRVAEEGGGLSELMFAPYSVMSPALAEHYGLDPAELSDDGTITLDGETYGGLLTQGSVLTAHALPTSSSPVHRGVLVRERLLCEELPPPPANLDTSPPEVDPTLSTRERYAQHTTQEECASCHSRIDPIGFGFEAYDGLGRWRATDAGQDVDATGELDGVDFDGVLDLSAVLLDDERFRSCYVRTWRRWATGVEACAEEVGEVALLEPALGLVERQHFVTRVGGAGEGDSLAVGVRPTLTELEEEEGGWGDVELTLSEVSRWSTGYCADGVVVNHGDQTLTWSVSARVEGSINNIWNAEANPGEGDETVFTGVSWNAVLEPGGEAAFGFCADT
ncbi:MAG: DUF1588 domain-containing protein [Alphaproteobacteria bacterium]|nr:DUF1588 domain-containing protein [Alphaproteobacteria bacterium]